MQHRSETLRRAKPPAYIRQVGLGIEEHDGYTMKLIVHVRGIGSRGPFPIRLPDSGVYVHMIELLNTLEYSYAHQRGGRYWQVLKHVRREIMRNYDHRAPVCVDSQRPFTQTRHYAFLKDVSSLPSDV